jgi:phosphatidate phosphatase APP1
VKLPGIPTVGPERALRVESHVRDQVASRLSRRGWVPRVLAYPGYGGAGWVRVLARVLLAPEGMTSSDDQIVRGWTRFVVLPTEGVKVRITVGERTHEVVTGHQGYLDLRLDSDLPPGWHEISLEVADNPPVVTRVHVVGPETRLGLLSDIDDTVIVTMLPRPLVAFRNTFLLREDDRRAVPGMAGLYQQIVEADPDVFVVYLSTGAWNVAGVLRRFLRRNGYPPGPMLMTDWGPTEKQWWRSGREHKRTQLTRLFDELPHLRWLLVGDDGQHDVTLYAEAVERHPDRVHAVLIRQLSATEQVATHGSPVRISQRVRAGETDVPEIRAPDGDGLAAGLREHAIVLTTP